jgi:hypothetical protein
VRVLIRRGDGSWNEPAITGHKSEDDLQILLATSPDLLPGAETGLPMAVAREFSVDPGRIDVVGVDVDGELTLCECKLAANPGARREVVGQLLEYAGALRGMDFDDFSARFEARVGRPLIASASAIAGEAFDEEAFIVQVTENLALGRFRLVVVVDKITPALKQTITYLNDHLDGSVLALELAYLRDGEVEMLLPAIYGEETAERKERARRSPIADADTVVVAARNAYQEYLDLNAYICQPGRPFRDEIKYLGFYKDKAIQREVPAIRLRRDGVLFTSDRARALSASDNEADRAIGDLIFRKLESGPRSEGNEYQVFLLSAVGDEQTLVLPGAIRNMGRGAWTQGQRYTASAALSRGPATTDELAIEGG